MDLVVPEAWRRIDLGRLRGLVLLVGPTDAGKSTLARWLYAELARRGRRVAYLDGDPGQSQLGPPTTLTLALGRPGDPTFPPQGQAWRRFLGDVSPRGHMLPLLVGAARLLQQARWAGAEVVLYDTTGLVDPAHGGVALKLAKIELLRPRLLIALDRDGALEPLLTPLRRSRRVPLLELPASPAAQRREPAARQAHRARAFAAYFAEARRLAVPWGRLAVFPQPRFRPHQLVGLEDVQGFLLGLGIVLGEDRARAVVELLTPLRTLAGVDALRLGDRAVEPGEFRDRPG